MFYKNPRDKSSLLNFVNFKTEGDAKASCIAAPAAARLFPLAWHYRRAFARIRRGTTAARYASWCVSEGV